MAEDWHQQRHRHAVATWAGAGGDHLLPDAKFGGLEGSGSGDCGSWEGRGGGGGCWEWRLTFAWDSQRNKDFVVE